MAQKGILKQIERKSGAFAFIFLLLFGVTFGFLALVGATPDAPGTTDSAGDTVNTTNAGGSNFPQPGSTSTQQQNTVGVLPTRISIKKIGLDVVVANPTSTDVDILDQSLLKGAVRYPTSGTLGVNGTVLLFGHSSYLPIVYNQAYKSFDGVQNLKTGDIISVFSGVTEYQFSVTSVKTADANNDIVQLPSDSQHLTLVTCDSFATKSDRFVVTADLVATNS